MMNRSLDIFGMYPTACVSRVLTAKPSLSPAPIYQLEPGGASLSDGHCYGITQSADKQTCRRL